MPTRRSVQQDIQQRKPFRSLAQEATIALLRTASVVGRTYTRVLEAHGLSFAQYNALRIIRGAGSAGIATLAIRERMIEDGTTITRLIDKLENAGLIERERSMSDRRHIICVATADGRRLLDRLDPLVDDADEAAVAALSQRQLENLVDALNVVRYSNAERGAAKNATAE